MGKTRKFQGFILYYDFSGNLVRPGEYVDLIGRKLDVVRDELHGDGGLLRLIGESGEIWGLSNVKSYHSRIVSSADLKLPARGKI